MKKFLVIISIILITGIGISRYINQKISFSVVIPVYNAEKYLARCLDSILAQKGDFEIIAVNDGSKDKSLQILQEYAKKYSNICIIDQKNQGISAARNAGMNVAKNKYITFVDNDDWLEPNAFSIVEKAIKKDRPDFLLSSFYDIYDKEWVRQTRGEEAALSVPEETKFPKRDMDKLVLFSPFNAQGAHSDLYYSGTWVVHSFFLKEFLTKHKMQFPSGMDNMEDLIFMYRAYAYNPRISVLAEPIYNYYNRIDSESKSMSTLNVLEERMAFMRQTPEYNQQPRSVQMYIDDCFLGTLCVSIANLQRRGLPLSVGMDKIYKAYTSMHKYNSEELKSCRYYMRLKTFLQQKGVNLPL